MSDGNRELHKGGKNMATLTFLDPIAANLTSPVISTAGRTTLTPTRNTAPWIYCNYPEMLDYNGKGMAFADNGYYINQQTINGSASLFYSHWYRGTGSIKYRIQIWNGNSSSATVTRNNIGHTTGWGNAATAVSGFFASSSTTISVPANSAGWLTNEYTISANTPFSGMVSFTTNKSVVITVYAYRSASTITGNAVAFPYSTTYANDVTVYSGRGPGSFLTFNHGTKNVSTLSTPYRYSTNANGVSVRNINELVPISIVGTNKTADINSSDTTLQNLGNWCAQNYHTITFNNNTTSTATVYGYVGSNIAGNTQVINRGGAVKSYVFSDQPSGMHTWRWCKLVLSANESHTFDFQQILASYGMAATFHEWKLS